MDTINIKPNLKTKLKSIISYTVKEPEDQVLSIPHDGAKKTGNM